MARMRARHPRLPNPQPQPPTPLPLEREVACPLELRGRYTTSSGAQRAGEMLVDLDLHGRMVDLEPDRRVRPPAR